MKLSVFLIPILILLTQRNFMELTPEKIEVLQDLHVAHQQRKKLFEENKTRLPNLFSEDEIRDLWNRIKRTDLLLYEYRVHLNNYEIPEEYIPKKQFILLVLELLLEYTDSENKDKIVEYARYSFDPEEFRLVFKSEVYEDLRTPFFKQLADEILVAESIKKIVRIWDRYAGYKKSDLLPHYKKEGNKEYYRGKEAKIHFLKSDLEFIKGSLDFCIKKAINDPDFPEIKQKLEEERKERQRRLEEAEKEKQRKLEEAEKEKQRKLEEEQKEFRISYKEWREKQKELASRMINNYSKSDHMLSRKKFFIIYLLYNSRWKKAQPELDKHILDSLSSSLKEDSATLKEIELALVNAISSSIDVPNEIVFRNWQKNRNFPDYYPIVSAVTGEVSKVSTYDIIEAYLGWYAEVAGVVDALKAPKKRYITQKLLDDMKGLLSSRKELAFLYEPFEEFISSYNERYLKSRKLSDAWRESLYRGIMNRKNIESAFAVELSSKKAISVEGLRDTLNGLAGVDTLQRIFRSAFRPSVQSHVLRKGPNLELPAFFSDGTDLLITIRTTIQKFRNQKGKEVPYITVQEEGVSCTIRKSGTRGFDYEIKDVLVSDYEFIETDGTVYVDYEYKIILRGQRADQTFSTESHAESSTETEKGQSTTETESTSSSYGTTKTIGGSIKLVEGSVSDESVTGSETGKQNSNSSTFATGVLQGKSQGSSVTAHGGVNALSFAIGARLKSSNIGSEILDVESVQMLDSLITGRQTIRFSSSIRQLMVKWKR